MKHVYIKVFILKFTEKYNSTTTTTTTTINTRGYLFLFITCTTQNIIIYKSNIRHLR